MEDRRIVYSGLRTPDGTILESHHRHDFKTYTDANGKEYMLDGGDDYIRSSVHGDEEFITIFHDDHHHEIRQWATRLHQTLGNVRIKDMSNSWLDGSIEWLVKHIAKGYISLNNDHFNILLEEQMYRKSNNITINETKSYKTGQWVPETYPTKEDFKQKARKERGRENELQTDERAISSLVEYAEENMLRDRNHLVWRTIEFIFSSRLGKGEVPSVHYV